MIKHPWPTTIAAIILFAGGAASSTPEDLPLPADQVMYLPDNPGEDIGLPLGATSAYAIGRSLQQQGQTEAALVYLNRAYRLAPGSARVARSYAQSLVEAGFVHDAARIYGELVSAAPDSLEQRRQYALLLAQSGRPRLALDQVQELERRGVADPMLTKLEADLLGQLDRVDDAIAVYREAAREDPARVEEYTLAAGALLQRHERYEEMAELLNDGLDSAPSSLPLRLALIRYLVHRDRFEEARAQAAAGDRSRRRDQLTERPECQLELSELLARRGDFDAAADVLEQARRDGFEDREVTTELARYRLGLGEVDRAMEILPEAARRWSEAAELRYLWGRALEMQEQPEEALVHLREAVDLEPTMAVYRISLLRLLVIAFRDDLAASEPDERQAALQDEALGHAAKAAVTVHPQDAEGHMILGYAYRALGDLDRACRQFHLAGEVNETRVGAMLELGFCLQEAGRLGEAKKTLHQLSLEFPDDPEVANSYGYLLAEMGEDLEHAEELVQRALAAEPDNGAYLDSLGWVYYKKGDYEQAFDWLVRAANARPDDPVILEHLGLVMMKQGQPGEALDLFRRALAAGGDREKLDALIAELGDGR